MKKKLRSLHRPVLWTDLCAFTRLGLGWNTDAGRDQRAEIARASLKPKQQQRECIVSIYCACSSSNHRQDVGVPPFDCLCVHCVAICYGNHDHGVGANCRHYTSSSSCSIYETSMMSTFKPAEDIAMIVTGLHMPERLRCEHQLESFGVG